MKKLVIFIALIAIGLTGFSKNVINCEKEGGVLRFNLKWGFYIGYDYVKQARTGENGNIRYWDLTCIDGGYERCKIQEAKSNIDGNTFDPSIIEEIFSSMMTIIDNKVLEEGILRGKTSKKYNLTSLEGKKCLIAFSFQWNLNKNCDGNVIITMEEVKI
ncbi:MAG: hypothetical protein LBM25_03880 [Bacteroidales bacterium]|jgi:hypothetical protein|nr:hypothetical protein [Bacteroidales bacterium]